MSTKNFSLLIIIPLISIFLVLLVFNTVIVSAATLDNYPGKDGAIILENFQGETFTLHHRLTYNQAASGFYIISVNWEYVNPNTGLPDNNYNFTLDNYMAYCDNGQGVECTITFDEDNGSLHSQVFRNENPDPNNYTFNVDIRYSLQGPDGTLHIATDNHPFHYTSIMYAEAAILYAYPDDVTIKVDAIERGVNVEISPENLSGLRGWTLDYGVTIKNTGSLPDNYTLIVSDNLGWGLTLDNNRFDNVQGRENRTTMLHVTIPDNAIPCTQDNIRVIATSMENTSVSAENKCMAHLARVTFEVSISPSLQSRLRKENLTYTVTLRNTTMDNVDFKDNYDLTIIDNSGWPLSDTRIENVPPGENGVATLTVTVPENAAPCTRDNITVTARSQADNRENRSGSCVAHSLAVNLSITPSENSAFPNDNLTYTVKIWSTSTSSENDNFRLTVGDTENWGLSISPSENIGVSSVENGTAMLTVTIPDNAIPLTRDNITVTAISQVDNNLSDNASCIAHALRRVPVLVSPANGENTTDTTPTFTWQVGVGADNHRIEMDNDLDFSSPVDNVVLGATDNTWTKPPPGYASGTYYWRVWAMSSAGASCSENTWNFTITPPEKPVLKKPINGENTTDTTPTFTWVVGAGVTYHRIEVDNDDNWTNGVVDNRILDDTDNTWTKPPPGYASGTYYWRVWAMSSAGESCSENTWNFKVITPGKPVLVSPENDNKTTDTTPTFTWTRGEGATSHRIEIDNDNVWTNGIIENKLLSPPNDNTWESENQLGVGNTYYWRVWAVSSAGESRSEDTWNFTVAAIAGVSISISPDYQEIQRGGPLTYTVTVVNTGNVVDSYTLTVNDDPGPYPSWGPTLDENQFLNVGPGENKTTTLRVTVSWYSPPNTSDNIIIRATSAENGSVYAENSCTAHSTRPWVTFYPTDDANVQETTRDNNYGTDWLFVGRSDNGAVRSFLKFEPTMPHRSTIEGASLNLFNVAGQKLSPTRTVFCHRVNNDDWSEGTITWNNKPSIDELLDSALIENTSAWSNWDVTSFVAGKLSGGDDKVSLAMVENEENTPPDHLSQFVNREYSVRENLRPQLNVVYSPTVSRSVLVTISPSHVYDYSGKTIYYSVTVQNVGWEDSSYMLENSDTEDWALWLKDTLFENIPPGENRVDNLTVKIPDDVTPDIVDNILVTATSVKNVNGVWVKENILDRRSCTAGILRPTVSISPSYEENLRGENLVYTVMVTNNTTSIENFALSVWDNPGLYDNVVPENWSWTLDNTLLENVPPGGNKTTTLTVTVSWNSPPATSDNITVIAISQRDNTVKGNASCIGHSKPLENVLYPIDDAYVWGVNPNNNYENDALYVGRKTDNARSFLKFDLSLIPGSIENARLSLVAEKNGINGGGFIVQCHRVDDDSWSEDTITWKHKPSIGIVLDNQSVTSELSRYFWDVTSFVKGESGGDNTVSFCMVGEVENKPSDNYIIFCGNEWLAPGVAVGQAYRPYLLVGYKPSSDATLASISISPENQSRLRGENLVYTVTVTNLGWTKRTYRLEDNDNLGWPRSISPSILENIPPGENRVATLTVTVPENATPCTRDNIVVRAILVDNESIYHSASCVAHSAVVSMEVTISSLTTYALKGRMLEYTITLTNLSTDLTLRDNYTLSFTDNAGWGSNISFYPENRIENVLTDNSKSVKLRVIIPENANPGTQDNITVKARSQENENVENSASCVAISGVLALEVSITPPRQDNTRGTLASYTVKITNKGTVKDNYTLENTDNTGWAMSLSPTSFSNVLPEESKTTTLKVKVSLYSPPGTSDNITIRATSAENENVWAENSCIASSKLAENVYPIDDAYVKGGAPENINYGDVGDLYVGRRPYLSPHRALLKFDLRLPGGSTIDNALLWLWATGWYSNPDVQCCRMDNDGWNEHMITWNNQPAYGEVLDSKRIVDNGKWYSWRVTDFVKNQFENENDQIVSFCMISPAGEEFNREASFSSKEGTNPPRLEVIYHGVNQHSVAVSISPNYISGMGIFTYSVTVQNVGWENNSYDVFYIYNTEKWPQIKLDNYSSGNIRLGENWTKALSVTMPPGTAPSTRNEITVKVRDNENLDVIGYAKCIAVVAPPILSISPPENNAPRGTTLTYTVRVTNLGTVPENFILSVRDNAVPSWNPTLDNYSLYVQPGENLTTSENVKVSWNSPPGTRDNITVRVALAADEDFWVENSCTAYSPLDNMKILPIDDSYVLENVSDNNYGTSNRLDVGWSSGAEWPQGRARSFLRFYLAIPGGSAIDSAQLYLLSVGQSGSPQVQCRVVNNDNWYEGTITWNDRPARGEVLDTQQINDTGVPFSWRVTDFVKNQFGNENDQMVSFCMAKASEEVENENWAEFYSKGTTSPALRPYLLVSYLISSHSPLVTISPDSRSFRDNVSYSVTVQNVGWENSSYTLENVDTLGWPIALDNYRFDNIRPGENRTTTLTVIIPENIAACARDEIIIKATCVESTEVIGSAICTAHAAEISRGVTVSISPLDKDYAMPGKSIPFIVTVTNTGNIEDTYDLTVRDDSGWGLTLSPTALTLTGGVSGTATLTVLIPDNLTIGVYDRIYVRATSRADNTISREGSCEAHTTSFYRKVEVSISPDNKSGLPGEDLTFTVTVTNKGSVRDNFLLTVGDNAVPSWNPTLSTWVWLENGASENLVLRVSIPNNATGGMEDNIQVTAQSKYPNVDNTVVSDNDSCIAQVIHRGVRVGISPAQGNAGPGENATFTVTITNTGGAADNYVLTGSDNAGWSLSLSRSTLSLAAGASGTATLTVTIPTGAENNMQDSVTVTARSLIDNTVENSASCVANCVAPPEHGVQVSIFPEDRTGLPGDTLDFTVTVKNTGNVDDTYDLTVSDDHGWELRLDVDQLTILAGENTTVTVSVTVPSDASEGDSTMITVTATSTGDPTKSATCTATATRAPPPRDIAPIAVGGAAIGGGLAAIAVLLKKGIIHLPSLRSRFMRSRIGPKF